MSAIINPHILAIIISGPQFITWVNNGNLTETAGSTIEIIGGGGSWYAAAYSVETKASGDIYCECKMPSAAEQGIFGLTKHADSVSAPTAWAQQQYAIFAFNGTLYSVQSGSVVTMSTSYTTNDIISVEVASGQVLYKKNGSVIKTVASPTLVYPLGVQANMETAGSKMQNCKVLV